MHTAGFRYLLIAAAGICIALLSGAGSATNLGTIMLDPSRIASILGSRYLLPSQTVPHKVIFQYGLSSVIVGRTPSGTSIGYRHELVVLVLSNVSDQDISRLRNVVPKIVSAQAQAFREALDAQKPPSSLAESKTTSIDQVVNKSVSDGVIETNAEFVRASQRFDHALASEVPSMIGRAALGIAIRACNAPGCVLDSFVNDPKNRSFSRFSKLEEWMDEKGMREVSVPYVLDAKTVQPSAKEERYLKTVASLDKGYQWQQALPEADLRSAFVNEALHVRKIHGAMSYISAELVSLSLDAASHVADVFDFAPAAAHHLATNPPFVLQGISDENARTRLIECVRLRGNFDAGAAGDCAGLHLSTSELTRCLGGLDCMPTFGTKVNPGALLVPRASSVASLAMTSALPRVSLGSFDELKSQAATCASQNANDGAAGFCLMKSRLNSDASAQVRCIQSASNYSKQRMDECAISLLPTVAQSQVNCLTESHNDRTKMAICAGFASLPPSSQKLVGCVVGPNAKQGMASTLLCMGAAQGSHEAACLMSSGSDWGKAAVCMSDGKLPAPVQAGLDCAQKSSDTMSFGVCLVAHQGSGDAQRVAACYVEGQGHPAAIAVCLAGPSLTVDQRIALECAAETNGAPQAWAVCTGGRFAMKELGNCRGKRFAEGNCFGENNDIRKLARQFGTDIGPNSVVAQMANVQLQIIEFETRPVVDAIPAITKVYANLPAIVKPPDLSHDPVTNSVVGGTAPILKPVVDSYCAHNWCP